MWLDAVPNTRALRSLAEYAYEHAMIHFRYCVDHQGPHGSKARNWASLVPAARMVRNDGADVRDTIADRERLEMSGKSTLLRQSV